ncbi:MAG TPA: formate dehydrogenase accessory sulfurtransferase FdhD [Haliangiales bacterium]|nr:formate dehydrogenase accessory sulfurtransferase FdhD [Haliangiales bacterium]
MDGERFDVVERDEWRGAAHQRAEDAVAREEPLEIRIGGVPVAVVMRTPGDDEELVRGFLVTERVVDRAEDVASVRHCADAAEDNVMQAVLARGVEVDLARLRRNLYASSSCGVCGKTSIAAAMGCAPPIADNVRVPSDVLYGLPARLRAAQEVFGRTGGLHAAGLFDERGEPLAVREDVGRHNAVDKIVGWAAAAGLLPLSRRILMVSGRVSFEIVQKALAARAPILAAVSAPSSLAVDAARAGGMTIVGFVRGERMCVYAGAERVG